MVKQHPNSPNDKIIIQNANLNLDQTGKVNTNSKVNQAFQTLGLTIEKISLAQDQIEIKLLDTSRAKNNCNFRK